MRRRERSRVGEESDIGCDVNVVCLRVEGGVNWRYRWTKDSGEWSVVTKANSVTHSMEYASTPRSAYCG